MCNLHYNPVYTMCITQERISWPIIQCPLFKPWPKTLPTVHYPTPSLFEINAQWCEDICISIHCYICIHCCICILYIVVFVFCTSLYLYTLYCTALPKTLPTMHSNPKSVWDKCSVMGSICICDCICIFDCIHICICMSLCICIRRTALAKTLPRVHYPNPSKWPLAS